MGFFMPFLLTAAVWCVPSSHFGAVGFSINYKRKKIVCYGIRATCPHAVRRLTKAGPEYISPRKNAKSVPF